jgi:hypothetical protein
LASACAASASAPIAMPVNRPAPILGFNSASLGCVQIAVSYADSLPSAKSPCWRHGGSKRIVALAGAGLRS